MASDIQQNSTVLITGAGGVLGKAVTACFQREGFVNLLTPSRVEMDLLNSESVHAYFKKHQPKVVIHLAATVFGLGGNLRYQMRAALENTLINDYFFSALQCYPPEYVFFAGTVASYPFPYSGMPLIENSFFNGLPHSGEFGYAMAKRHAYTYLHLLNKEMGLRFTYGILTNLYGPYDRFDISNGHVIPSLIAKAHDAVKNGHDLEVWGDGAAERDFLYSEDAARAILYCFDHDQKNQLINISSGQGVSIRHVAEIIGGASGVKNIRFATDKPTGIPRRVVNNQRLLDLGFKPSVSMEEGLMETYRWYANNLEIVRR